MHRLKEAYKKKTVQSLNTLAEAADQLENPPSVLKDGEHDELLSPECGDLFKLVGYRVAMVDLTTWKLIKARHGREEIPPAESMEERKPRMSITHDHELQEK